MALDEKRGQGRNEEKRREEEGGAHRGGRCGRGANPAGWTTSRRSTGSSTRPGLSESTRRAYASDLADFGGWLERTGRDARGRRRAGARRVHRRARPRPPRARARDDRPAARGRAVVHPASRSAPPACRRSPCRRDGGGACRMLRSSPRSRRSSPRSRATAPLAVRNAAILELTYSCGLRSAEVVGLRLADVDFEQEAVHVLGKGGKERIVPLGERAAHAVATLPPRRAALARARRDRHAVPLRPRARARHVASCAA